MPAKEQVSETQVKETSQNDESLSNSSSTQGSPTGLIHKLYDAVLSREVVKKGVKTIKAKYHDVLVEGGKQIHVIKSRGEKVYIDTRERVKNWAYSITIYNQFTSLWLIKNLPYGSQKVVTFDDFLSSFQVLSKDTTKESEHLAKSFYKHAHQLWEGLKEPELEDIKQCCLNIVAQTIAADFKIEVHGFAHLLVELFKSLDSKQAEVITNEAFYLQIHRKITHKIHNEHEFRKATDTFYTFAKRFAFLEFPLTYANQDILRVLVKFAQEKLEIVAEVFLNRVDGLLNVVIKKLGYEYEHKEAPVSLLDKYNRIVEKLVVVSSNSYNKTRLAIQESKVYQYADKRIHFEDRYNDLVRISKQILDTATVKLTPVVNAITLQYNKITKEYVFTLYDVSRELVKENYAGLKKRYSALKEATLKLRDNILEIKLSKETFEKLSADAKEQIALIYAEVRGLNYEKLKVIGGKAYQRAVEAVRTGVKAIKSRGHHSAEKPAVKGEEPKKAEEQPKKSEEQPKKVEEPKKAEEQPKKVEEEPKKEEESPQKHEESPQKHEESPQKHEESPQKEEESPQKHEESSPEKEHEEEEHHSENNEEEDQ